jgi:hypothetical protein
VGEASCGTIIHRLKEARWPSLYSPLREVRRNSRHLVLEDFEGAGMWVAERRFTAKDAIFGPDVSDQQIGTKALQSYTAV